MPRRIAALAWLVVVLVGALVVGLVYGLKLPSRLDAGQRVIDGLRPGLTTNRVAGARAGVNMASAITNLADPVVTPQGGATDEIPKLVAFVAGKTGLPPAAVLAALKQNAPHTTALLQAVPLSAVNAEVLPLVNFLAGALHLSADQVLAALKANFPHLTQAITTLPAVTSGWYNVPGTEGLTRFDGTAVHSVPQVRDYFSADVIPVLEHHRTDFGRLDTYWPPVKSIPIILTAIGVIVILFGLLMMIRWSASPVKKGEARAEWSVVLLVGVVVLAIVFGTQLFPRLDGGQHLIRDASPVFQPARVAGSQAGITMVSKIVDTADPLVTPQGGGAGEVGPLLAFVSSKTGLPAAAVANALSTNFPHIFALLNAIPLTAVTAELAPLEAFLAKTLNVTQPQLLTALQTNFPRLTQVIVNLPIVTEGWNNVAGTAALTRFSGSAVHTVPQVRDYFAQDLIPAVVKVAPDFRKLATTNPPLDFFPPLLTFLGYIVIFYAVVMLILLNLPDPNEELAARRTHRRSRPATA